MESAAKLPQFPSFSHPTGPNVRGEKDGQRAEGKRGAEGRRDGGKGNLFRLYLISSLASQRRDLLSSFNPDSGSRRANAREKRLRICLF